MTSQVWYEYEYLMPGRDWKGARFSLQRYLGLDAEPTDEAEARETMQVVANRFRPAVRFRLVRMTRDTLDGEVRNVVHER